MNRKEKALETKKKIIKAAEELSGEKLISDITVEDITKKAKVSKGSFYTYFATKEDVLLSFVFKNYQELRDKILSSKKDFVPKLLEYFYSFFKLIEDSGKEACRSWIASNVSSDIKLIFDEETLEMIFTTTFKNLKKEHIKNLSVSLNSFLYGVMLSWAMSDKTSLLDIYKSAEVLFISLLKEMEENYVRSDS